MALLVLPPIALNLATRFPNQYGMKHHYDDMVAPLLFFAALVVLDDLRRCPAFRQGGATGRSAPQHRRKRALVPELQTEMVFEPVLQIEVLVVTAGAGDHTLVGAGGGWEGALSPLP